MRKIFSLIVMLTVFICAHSQTPSGQVYVGVVAFCNNGGILYLIGNLFHSNTGNSRNVIYNASGAITSGGYNVSDMASGSESSGFTFTTGDKQVTTVPINPTNFIPTSSGATDLNIVPAGLSDFPKIDFYGTARNAYPTAAGAATATASLTTHTVTFAVASEEVSVGTKVTQAIVPAREGYTFEGWYRDAECTTTWNFDSDVVTSDLTLYAKWTNGGSAIKAAVVEPVTVYPNPAKNEIYIQSKTPVEKVEILDISGRIVVSTNSTAINVSALPQGIHFVRVFIDGQSITKKIIKE